MAIKKTPVLETNRLLLRCFEDADAPRVAELAGHEDIAARTLNIPHPYNREHAEMFIQFSQGEMQMGSGYNFAIVQQADRALVGCIGLTLDRRHQHAELGYWLGVPYWNKGYTTEASIRAIQFGFEELSLHRIFAQFFTSNPASGRVMEKAGMHYEGTMRGHYVRFGTHYDVGIYGLLREDYLNR
ncbi:MAG: GNAT family protein [Anaerolineae bacterium]